MTKNKLGFVDESNAKPSDPNSPLFQVWWNEIYSNWAHDIWMGLKVQYIQRNGPRIFELKKDLGCNTPSSLIVGEYFTTLEHL